jgi:biopolymer transport protein ExbD
MARKMRSEEEVVLNLASMLDMAFQLLAFFILTFQPPPPELQIRMHMPPPVPVIGVKGAAPAGEQDTNEPVKPVDTLIVTVILDNSGTEHITVGVPSVAPPKEVPFNQLNDELGNLFRGSAGAFEQVLVQASPELRYGELMRVVEVCSNQIVDGQKLKKLSFVALPPQQTP